MERRSERDKTIELEENTKIMNDSEEDFLYKVTQVFPEKTSLLTDKQLFEFIEKFTKSGTRVRVTRIQTSKSKERVQFVEKKTEADNLFEFRFIVVAALNNSKDFELSHPMYELFYKKYLPLHGIDPDRKSLVEALNNHITLTNSRICIRWDTLSHCLSVTNSSSGIHMEVRFNPTKISGIVKM